jgi:uncharacterized protein YwgA
MSDPVEQGTSKLRVWLNEGHFHCNDGAGEFVRQATRDEKLLWAEIEALTENANQHLADVERLTRERWSMEQIATALRQSLYAKTGKLAIEGIIEDLSKALPNGGVYPTMGAAVEPTAVGDKS